MSRFLTDHWDGLTAYTPGEQPRTKLLKLNTNESPFAPSPRISALLETQKCELHEELRLYPDPTYALLADALGKTFPTQKNIAHAERFFVGSGSDEVLATVFMAYGQGKRIYYPSISYGFYPVYAKVHDANAVALPLRDDFSIEIEGYCRNDGTVLIANPNAPTGLALSREEIEHIVRSNPDHVVVIDEAYVDFGAESAVPLIDRYENLLVIQTLSKSRGLAGLRFGFAVGDPELIADLKLLQYSRNPYPIGRLTEKIAVESLLDTDYFRNCTEDTVSVREQTRAELEQRGWACTDSKANFLFAAPPNATPEKTESIVQSLRKHDILVRYFKQPLLSSHIRITIGTGEQMEEFLQRLATIEGGQ